MLPASLIALVFALALGGAWLAWRRRGLARVALLWLLYAGYEFLMYRRILCSGECNIRIDLLLFYPLLLGATLWVLATAAWAGWGARNNRKEKP